MSSFALRSTKWTLDIATRMIKANVRVHNAGVVTNDMAVVFVANHFTRLETLLLPYEIHKHTGKECRSLAAEELFVGHLGTFLRSTGAMSTHDPDRDRTIVRSLLEAEHPWIIFSDDGMIKDREAAAAGKRKSGNRFHAFSGGVRRPPHRGAAVLALRAEFYRQKLACLRGNGEEAAVGRVLGDLKLESSVDEILGKRTVIIPVGITYYPIRADEDVFLALAERFAESVGQRTQEELSVEGTVLAQDTDIDITFGEALDVGQFLAVPEHVLLLTSDGDGEGAFALDSGTLFPDAAERLMQSYMTAICSLTTVNIDHILASLLHCLEGRTFAESSLRDRACLCARRILEIGDVRTHPGLRKAAEDTMSCEKGSPFDQFVGVCIREGILTRHGDTLEATPARARANVDPHSVGLRNLVCVIAEEIEPLEHVRRTIRWIAWTPSRWVRKHLRSVLFDDELALFASDYQANYEEGSTKEAAVGRPFLLIPWRPKGGVVLVHGYMAAPLEVRALADYLFNRRYAVYGVRLKGHGTSPADLAETSWEDWYASVARGYGLMRTITERVILGGFSMGAGLALLAAARRGPAVNAVFAIDAPIRLRNPAARLAPSIVRVNTWLKRFNWSKPGWEYLQNDPENKHINYTSNPVAGVAELGEAMGEVVRALPEVTAPALILHGSRDPVVDPEGGHILFDKLGTHHKELCVLDRDRHGIINGPGAEQVFGKVVFFLEHMTAGAAG